MSRMHAELVHIIDGNYYYIINYNCGVKLSDYILLRYDGANVYEVYLTNGIYVDSKVSGDGTQIAINFIQTSGDIVFNNLIRFDLVNMKAEFLDGVTEYKYQMKSYEWADDDLNVEYSLIEEDN